MSGIPEGEGDVTQAGDNVFTGTNTYNVNRPTSTLSGTPASTDFITKQDGDGLYGTGSGDVVAAGNNAFTGTNTFNVNRPTSTLTGTPLSTAFITKADGDGLYGTGDGDVTQAGNNVFTGTNSFNTNRPTSTLATTPSSTDFITKADADTLYNTQITTNTGNITTNTNNITTLDGEVVKLSGNQILTTGVKTFNDFPRKSGVGTDLDPTIDAEFATKQYVDDTAGTPTNMVTTDTNQTITGQKQFGPVGGTTFPTFFTTPIKQTIASTYFEQTADDAYIEQAGTDSFIRQSGFNNILEQTNTSSKIVTDGKIGIGTSSPTEKLHVVGTALIQGTSSVVGTTVLQGSSSVSTPTLTMGTSPYQKGFAIYTDPYIRCVGVQTGMMTHNQYCALACGTFYAAQAVRFGSDDKIKHNEQEIPDALDLIDELKPYKYKKSENIYDASYNGDISGNWEWEIGLIAQDILKIPYLSFAVGNDPDNKIHTLNYSTFIGVLIQGVKDLNEKNKELEARIKILEANI